MRKLRKMEWLPWGLIGFFGSITALWFISQPNPESYTPVTVEIIGTFVGFFVAIAFAEIIKLADKINSAKDLGYNFVEMLLDYCSFEEFILEKSFFPLPMDIWESSISTGDWLLLDKETQYILRMYFMVVKEFNENSRNLILRKDDISEKTKKEYQKYLKYLRSQIADQARIIVKEYGTPEQRMKIEK